MRLVDRFAYVNHDIDDAVRAGILDPASLPAAPMALLGDTSSERIDALVHDLVETPRWPGRSASRPGMPGAARAARVHVPERLPGVACRARRAGPAEIVEELFGHYVEQRDELPGRARTTRVTRATDWVAGMTDQYAARATRCAAVRLR